VTDRAVPPQATQDYRADLPPGTPSERVHVALVAGSGSVTPDDLYPLLRRRLLILSSIVACAFFIGLTLDLVLRVVAPLPPELQQDAVVWIISSWRALVNLGVAGGSAILLWRGPPRSVRGLRLIEVLVIGTLVLLTLSIAVHPVPYGHLERAAQESSFEVRQAFVSLYTCAGSLIWFIIITSYGTLIPNTWRRCAAVVSMMAMSPLAVIALHAFWLRPLPPEIANQVLLVHGFYNGVAATIAIFASSRIEILRRQAAEARKFGQYVLRERLGAGGMGEVYRAEHVLLRRPCALKVIRAERAGEPKNLRRFEREVQATAALTHPNTVQIFDYGHAEDGTFYYVMEYLPGLTLEDIVEREGPLPAARAVHVLRQICGALKEAHGRGLIHRDIKPGNVMICERGGIPDVAKLLDFGLVLPPVSAADGERLTQEGMVTGTPAYLSPEQADGQETVDTRSDIYSLGALAYFLLTGQPPFAGRSGVKMLAAHLYEQPVPLSARNPNVLADLEAVVLRCLAKEPAGRFADVADLEEALAACRIEKLVERDGPAA
jgi:eukaryotic-like serine/threonine-protein kinase